MINLFHFQDVQHNVYYLPSFSVSLFLSFSPLLSSLAPRGEVLSADSQTDRQTVPRILTNHVWLSTTTTKKKTQSAPKKQMNKPKKKGSLKLEQTEK